MTFSCPYADRGQNRCPSWRCDCFVDTHPDDPFGLHPEAFTVNGWTPPPLPPSPTCRRCGDDDACEGYAWCSDCMDADPHGEGMYL